MYPLQTGEYSLVNELYFPNSIDGSTVEKSAASSVETVSNVTTNVFCDHRQSVIHIPKYNNAAPNCLMIDMVLKNKAGEDYAKNLTIFIVVYGLKGILIMLIQVFIMLSMFWTMIKSSSSSLPAPVGV